MESKRKANGAAQVETDDRASKRRKLAVSPSHCFHLHQISALLSLLGPKPPRLRDLLTAQPSVPRWKYRNPDS